MLSRYEIATGQQIARDCGYSVPSPLPGGARWSLWLFCDTAVLNRSGAEVGLPILGTGTAAAGSYTPGVAPGPLSEVATPGGSLPSPGSTVPGSTVPGAGVAGRGPEPFLPAPAETTLPGSTLPCTGTGLYPARWFSGAAAEPGAPGWVLISYDDVCVTGSSVFTPEAFGLILYNPALNQLGQPAQVFTANSGQTLAAQWLLGAPLFRDGYLYLFSTCTPQQHCGGGGVFLARAPAVPAGWQDGYAYQYWTGSGWSSAVASSAPLTGRLAPLGSWAGDFSSSGHGLVLIEQTSLNGDFRVYRSVAGPSGPWRVLRSGRVPCGRPRSPVRIAGVDFCRAVIGHPELSTRNTLMISFFNPATEHVEVSPFSW